MKEDLIQILIDLGYEIDANAIAKGFDPLIYDDWKSVTADNPEKIGLMIAMVHSELSEAMESLRWSDKKGFTTELADAVIRIIGMCHGLRVDLGSAILEKIEKNKTREKKHGGKAF